MKQLAIFLVCFTSSFTILYMISGSIFMEKEESPISTIESAPDKTPVIKAKFDKRTLMLYTENSVENAHYNYYDEKDGKKNFEVYCKKMIPSGKNKVRLENPSCIYYEDNKKNPGLANLKKFVINSYYGYLQLKTDNKKVDSLFLKNNVKINGYKDKNVDKTPNLIMTMKSVKVNFKNETLSSESDVYLSQINEEKKKILELRATGIEGNVKLNKLKFLKNVKFKIHSSFWKKKDKSNIDFLYSKSKGKALLNYNKKTKELHIYQEKNVRIEANNARLFCDSIDLHFKSSKSNSFELKKLKAVGNVLFKDGDKKSNNKIKAGYFYLENMDKNRFNLVLKKNPQIDFLKLSSVSLLGEKAKKNIKKKEDRYKVQTLLGKSSRSIEWKRDATKGMEELIFIGDVCIRETSKKVKLLQLNSEYANLLIKIAKKKNRVTRIPQTLIARKNVIITHSQGKGSGEYFKWERIDDDSYMLELSQNPVLEIYNLKLGNKMLGGGFANFNLGKKDKKKRSLRKKEIREDIKVRSQKPMYVISKKQNKEREFKYYTEKKVVINRYESGSKEKLGDFYCQKILAVISKSKKHDKKNVKKRMGLSYVLAQGEVSLDSKDLQGGASQLSYDQRGKKNILILKENAWVKNKDGKISADFFKYDKNSEIFEAAGKTVIMDGKEMGGISKKLIFLKKQNHLKLIGKPAQVWQFDTNHKKQYSLKADIIDYWKDKGKINTDRNTELYFVTGSKKFDFFSKLGKKDKKNKKIAQKDGKTKKYKLLTEHMTAIFDTKTEKIKNFRTSGKVTLERLLDQFSMKQQEKITGDWLIYKNENGILWGNPAKVYYHGSSLFSNKITFSTKNKNVSCQGPGKVILSEIKNKALKKEQVTTIMCQGPILFSDEKQEIEFTKDVKVKSQEAELDCQSMKALLKDQKIKTIVAYKNVIIRSKENVAFADQLRWHQKTSLALLIASPAVRVETKDFDMHAPLIWYNTKEKRFFTYGKNISINSKIQKVRKNKTKGKK